MGCFSSFLKVGARVNVRLRVQLMDALLMQGKPLSHELLLACGCRLLSLNS
jgi:hypothetical protein